MFLLRDPVVSSGPASPASVERFAATNETFGLAPRCSFEETSIEAFSAEHALEIVDVGRIALLFDVGSTPSCRRQGSTFSVVSRTGGPRTGHPRATLLDEEFEAIVEW